MCLACFDRRAENAGVDYSGDLAIMGHGCWLATGEAISVVGRHMGIEEYRTDLRDPRPRQANPRPKEVMPHGQDQERLLPTVVAPAPSPTGEPSVPYVGSAWSSPTGGGAEHNLKAWPDYFRAVVDGRKTFEVRRNGRSLPVNRLRLREWDPERGYTGCKVTVVVTYLADLEPVTGHPLVGMSIRRSVAGGDVIPYLEGVGL